jgi:hypothetical protein
MKPKRLAPSTISPSMHAELQALHHWLASDSLITMGRLGVNGYTVESTPEAQEYFLETEKSYQWLAREQSNVYHEGYWSKAARLLGSLALIFYCVEKKPGAVQLHHFEMAQCWVTHIFSHIQKIYK